MSDEIFRIDDISDEFDKLFLTSRKKKQKVHFDDSVDIYANFFVKDGLEIVPQKLEIPRLEMSRIGFKIIWTNFDFICKYMARDIEHVKNFILKELSTTGNLSIDNYFNIKGRFNEHQLTAIIGKYINEYVKCRNCNDSTTFLKKSARLITMECLKCKSVRTVGWII